MAAENTRCISIGQDPVPHIVVSDWTVADLLDDYLTEVCDLEFFYRTVDNEGRFVARLFFPSKELPEEKLRGLVESFCRECGADY